MSIQAILLCRREELRRRVDALPNEIESWRARSTGELDLQVHFSQLGAIQVLMAVYTDRQQASLNRLDPEGDVEAFRRGALALTQDVIKAQKVWDFFRGKLELRFSPTFKDVLWVADTVAWDCYRPVLEAAADEDILPKSQFREPPLTYLTAEFSPATWVRGSHPHDGRDYALGTATLPIPTINLPWDHIENVWEFLTIHHEVGHDLEADLKLRPVLQSSLTKILTDAEVPPQRIGVWAKWQGEVFADLVALQLGGPAFAEVLANLLLLPEANVVNYHSKVPHPTPYLRILMNAAYMRTLAPGVKRIEEHSTTIESWWKTLYAEQPQFQEFESDFSLVFRALMDTPLERLRGNTVRSLLPFSADDDVRIRAAAGYLLSGRDKPQNIPPRHCVSAARLAVSVAATQPLTLSDNLQAINERTRDLIRDKAAPGLRAADDSRVHREFIAGFADTITDIG